MFCAILLLLVQVVDRPAPFHAFRQITPLQQKTRRIDLLSATVIFIEIFCVHHESRMNHLVVSIRHPQAVWQVTINMLVGRLRHPVVILPLDEHIGILVIVVFAVTLRVLGGRSRIFVLAQGALEIAQIRRPVIAGNCVVCGLLCQRHCLQRRNLLLQVFIERSRATVVEPLIRRIAVIGEVAIALLVVEAEEQAVRADGRRDLDRSPPAAEGARPDFCRTMRACRLFRHDVNDAADEGAAEARGDVAAIDFDALDVADGNRRDVDRRDEPSFFPC